jgi:type IV pilus assembly protein PilC
VLDFTTQLAVMVRAGINLRAALEGIAEQTEHAAFKKVIAAEGGRGGRQAVFRGDREAPQAVQPAVCEHGAGVGDVGLVQQDAGPNRGVHRAADRDQEDGDRARRSTPAIIGTLAVGVTVFLLTFVLPKFASVFEGKEDVLPWATKFLMALSSSWWRTGPTSWAGWRR